jgi:DNA-binding CsgD family transcriptional regulator
MAADTQSAVSGIRDIYGFDNVTYHLAQTISGNVDAPFVKSTYPDAWVSRYLLRGYVRIDPVVREGFQRRLPFDWREIMLTEQAGDFMEDAKAHGLGGNGYSIPVLDRAARHALLSFNSSLSDDEWSEFIAANAADLAELAHRVHKKAIDELYGPTDPVPALGPRELECLTWAAHGKDSKTIAMLLGISDHTARNYLKSARFKLDCANIAQAVTKAIKLRLIVP